MEFKNSKNVPNKAHCGKNTIIDCNVHVVIKRERLTNPYNIIHGNNLRKL